MTRTQLVAKAATQLWLPSKLHAERGHLSAAAEQSDAADKVRAVNGNSGLRSYPQCVGGP